MTGSLSLLAVAFSMPQIYLDDAQLSSLLSLLHSQVSLPLTLQSLVLRLDNGPDSYLQDDIRPLASLTISPTSIHTENYGASCSGSLLDSRGATPTVQSFSPANTTGTISGHSGDALNSCSSVRIQNSKSVEDDRFSQQEYCLQEEFQQEEDQFGEDYHQYQYEEEEGEGGGDFQPENSPGFSGDSGDKGNGNREGGPSRHTQRQHARGEQCPKTGGGRTRKRKRTAAQRRMGPEGLGQTNDADSDGYQDEENPMDVDQASNDTAMNGQDPSHHIWDQEQPTTNATNKSSALAKSTKKPRPKLKRACEPIADYADAFLHTVASVARDALLPPSQSAMASNVHQVCIRLISGESEMVFPYKPNAGGLEILLALAKTVRNTEIMEACLQFNYWINVIKFSSEVQR